MKILPQAGDLVRPVFLELVQTTGNFSFMKILPQAGCGLQPMVVAYNLWLYFQFLPKMENSGKNGKFWKKWKILEKRKILAKMENSGNWQSERLSAKTVLAVGAFEC